LKDDNIFKDTVLGTSSLDIENLVMNSNKWIVDGYLVLKEPG